MTESRLGPRQVDYAELYDEHEEYAARRSDGSFEQLQVELEVKEFKIPNLIELIPTGEIIRSVLEIGCATGELIGNFPVCCGGTKVGCDISPSNIAAARTRFPNVDFFAGDFSTLPPNSFDCVILSDVLEHVEDDSGFLHSASKLARFTLVNLPLEDNWLNRNRPYGPGDVSGHLRSYSLQQGLDLIRVAGLDVLAYRRIWIHEMEVETKRRALRKQFMGHAFSGSPAIRLAKSLCLSIAGNLSLVGRVMFASNLFAVAVPVRD